MSPPSPSPSPKHLSRLSRPLPTSSSDTLLSRSKSTAVGTNADQNKRIIKPFILRSTSPYPSPPLEDNSSSGKNQGLNASLNGRRPSSGKGKGKGKEREAASARPPVPSLPSSMAVNRLGLGEGEELRRTSLGDLTNSHSQSQSNSRTSSPTPLARQSRPTRPASKTKRNNINFHSSPPLPSKPKPTSFSPSSLPPPPPPPPPRTSKQTKYRSAFSELGYKTPSPKARPRTRIRVDQLSKSYKEDVGDGRGGGGGLESVKMERSLAFQGSPRGWEVANKGGEGITQQEEEQQEMMIGYSSLEEMLASSGFLDTRIITPLSLAHHGNRTKKPSPPPLVSQTYSPGRNVNVMEGKSAVEILRREMQGGGNNGGGGGLREKKSFLDLLGSTLFGAGGGGGGGIVRGEVGEGGELGEESEIEEIDNDLINCGSESEDEERGRQLGVNGRGKDGGRDESRLRAKEWAEEVARETATSSTTTLHPTRQFSASSTSSTSSTSNSDSNLTIRPSLPRAVSGSAITLVPSSFSSIPSTTTLGTGNEEFARTVRHTLSDPSISTTYQFFNFPPLDFEIDADGIGNGDEEGDEEFNNSGVRIEFDDVDDMDSPPKISKTLPSTLNRPHGSTLETSKSLGVLRDWVGGGLKRASQYFVWEPQVRMEEEKVEEKEVPKLLRQKSRMLREKRKATVEVSTDKMEGEMFRRFT